MTCPDDGVLRAWIDAHPTDEPPQLDRHLASCTPCRARTGDLRRTADAAVPALALLAPSRPPTAADTEAALASVRSRALTDDPLRERAAQAIVVPIASRRPPGLPARMRRPASAAAALTLALSVFGTPAGRSAASEFLGHFRSERFAAVTVNEQDVNALADLSHLGTVSGDLSAPNPKPVDSLAAAGALAGFAVATPDPARLPSAVRRTPVVLVSAPRQLRFTFDAEKARQWVDSHGGKGTALPDRFDGVSLVVAVPAAVVLEYDAADGTPGLVVGQARSIEARTEGGVGFDELRRFLLGLPGLTAGTRAQLAAIGDWQRTLPLPIPAGRVSWKHTTIAGADGLLVGDNTGLGSAVLWQRDGRIYGVAGPAPATVVRDVAVSLR